jgi:hypothetical protein
VVHSRFFLALFFLVDGGKDDEEGCSSSSLGGDLRFLSDVAVMISSGGDLRILDEIVITTFCVMVGRSAGGGGRLVSMGRQISGIAASTTAAVAVAAAGKVVVSVSIRTVTGAGASP